jgi:hypothetical protein
LVAKDPAVAEALSVVIDAANFADADSVAVGALLWVAELYALAALQLEVWEDSTPKRSGELRQLL